MAFYRRNLPHLIIPGYPFFVTTRLAGSLPQQKLNALREEFQKKMQEIQKLKNKQSRILHKKELHRTFFLKYDDFLHERSTGPTWLANEQVAQIVHDSLHWGDGRLYHLIAFTLMPNHIHVVLLPRWENHKEKISREREDEDAYFLARIMESFKKFTARKANKILGRQGQFWQHESYDHLIRNERELKRAVNYTLQNPVKAGLAATPDDYRWNYVNWDFL
ncbi:transposase [Caldithrix abyssi]